MCVQMELFKKKRRNFRSQSITNNTQNKPAIFIQPLRLHNSVFCLCGVCAPLSSLWSLCQIVDGLHGIIREVFTKKGAIPLLS